MRDYIILIGLSVLWLIAGYIFGKLTRKKPTYDGTVFLEPTEDGERDRIRFVLDMELNEITTKDQLLLKVDNQLSKN